MSAENQLKKSNSEISYISSIRQQVFNALKKNPLLTCKSLCKLMDLDYKRQRQYIYNLQSEWRSNYKNSLGLKGSNCHNWLGCCFVPIGVDRVGALGVGWKATKSRNRYYMWKDEFGRLEWFETGRVKVWVRKPASLGKAFELVCSGFFGTGLVFDFRVMKEILKSVRFKGASYVFETEQRLPKLVIDLFGESNGVKIKLGDRSHPHAVEVDVWYPDWAERNERLFEKMTETLERLTASATPSSPAKIDYAV